MIRTLPPICIAAITTLFSNIALAQCVEGWRAYDAGANGTVRDLVTWDPDGAGPEPELLIACGAFTEVGGVACKYVAAWDGKSWRALGELPGFADALVVHQGSLFVAASQVRRWNLSEWEVIADSPLNVECMYSWQSDLVVGGYFAGLIKRWDGAAWHDFADGFRLGSSESDPVVRRVLEFEGELYACGNFQKTGNRSITPLARWDGVRWNSVDGVGASSLTDMGVYDEELYVSQAPLGVIDFVYRWDTITWTALSEFDDSANRFGTHEEFFVVVGVFDEPGSAVVLYDGNTYWTLGTGLGGASGARTFASFRGDLIVGGGFTSVEDRAIKRFAIWGPILPGDANHDQRVDLSDLGVLLAAFGACPGDEGYVLGAGALADDGNDCIDLADLGLILANYLKTCE